MKTLLIFLVIPFCAHAQTVTTETFTEKRWLLNSGINLPAAKFHLTENHENHEKGYLELFSSFGVGLSLNFGDATFIKDIDKNLVLNDQTEFSNLVGFQLGILYSSKISDQDQTQLNLFSLYTGLNILDLQLGGGFEFGSKIQNSTGWFVSVSYGIPIYKLTGSGAFLFKKKTKVELVPKYDQASL